MNTYWNYIAHEWKKIREAKQRKNNKKGNILLYIVN